MSFRKITASVSGVALSALPFIAFAQAPSLNRGITGVLLTLNNALNMLIGILITAAIVVFFYGLVKYLWSNAGEEKQNAIKIMVNGVVVIFVMVSIWGLVALLQFTLGVNGRQNITFPTGAPVNSTPTLN
ncbi:hypothetical protein EBR66_01260 [bacterium]|nr:hypothetical protein [bacterium]